MGVFCCFFIEAIPLLVYGGLTQFTGKDFFSTEAGKTFLTVGMDSSVKEALRFHYGENSEVYMASYTPDYVGIYLVIIFPIVFFLAVTAGKIWQKVLWSVLFGILLICLWGSGPDTFAAEFPQTDYVMKANTGAGMYQQLPTKANSLYLQTALQTGVLSLLCLMLFWGRYLFCFIKTFFSNENKAAGRIKLAVFLGIAVEKIN